MTPYGNNDDMINDETIWKKWSYDKWWNHMEIMNIGHMEVMVWTNNEHWKYENHYYMKPYFQFMNIYIYSDGNIEITWST
jgi:hypothetical protein